MASRTRHAARRYSALRYKLKLCDNISNKIRSALQVEALRNCDYDCDCDSRKAGTDLLHTYLPPRLYALQDMVPDAR